MKLTKFIFSLSAMMLIGFAANAQTPSPSVGPTPSDVPLCIDMNYYPEALIYVPCPSTPPEVSPSPTPIAYPCAPGAVDEVLLRKEEVKLQAVLPECIPTPTPVEPSPTPETNEEVIPTPTPIATPVTQVTTPSNVIEGSACSLNMAQAGLLPMQVNGYFMLVITWIFGAMFLKRNK